MRTILFAFILSVATVATSVAWAAPEVIVDVELNPAGDFKAKTTDVVGHATLDGDTVRAENLIVKLNNLDTGRDLRTKHMRDKYLQVDKFPEAILTKAIGRGGKGRGLLKIRGVEKEVGGTYKIEGGFLRAEFPIKFSNYGITGVSYMGVGVNDDGKITVVVPVKKK